jgi:L-malate glycosyltransferase
MGGFRVVYEYANRLVSRGHEVTIVHPRSLQNPPFEEMTILQYLRRMPRKIRSLISTPSIRWHSINNRVDLRFVPTSAPRYIPEADVLFATAWQTVHSVLACSSEKGRKCYLIQGYETWMGPKALVDNTWRADLRKIAVSQYLVEIGRNLGCQDLAYIPSAIDQEVYRLLYPVEARSRRVVMLFSTVSIKGAVDGISALQIAKSQFPELQVVLFGTDWRPSWIPRWMVYLRDPPQERIIRDLYNNSSIVLSCSISEGFPAPPAEGAACGCAIVSTDSGGVRDYVEHGVTGLLSAPCKPQDLAANLCLLLENDDMRIRLAHAGRARVRDFNWERSTNLLERFLNS